MLGVPASAWIGQIRPDSLAGVVGDAAVGCGGYVRFCRGHGTGLAVALISDQVLYGYGFLALTVSSVLKGWGFVIVFGILLCGSALWGWVLMGTHDRGDGLIL